MDRSEKRAEAEKEYASLVVKVADRDALPVRVIPYVTGWTISPDVVAKNFARDEAAPFEKLENTDTYHLVDGRPVKLLPKEWDRYVAALQGLEAELREQFANDDRGYATWVSQSVAKLPAGVFVWLDEFVADFERDYGPDRISIMGERSGDRELNLSPFLEDEALNMALEGFERRTPLRTHASDDSYAGLVEFVQNGRVIDWSYWVQNMPTLSLGEACRLMAGLDPELFEDLAARPVPKNDPSRACAEARRMERLALAEGRGRLSPDEWYRWALERDFSVHRGYFLAAYSRHLSKNEQQVLSSMPPQEAATWESAPQLSDGRRQVATDYARHFTTVSLTFPEFYAEVEERLARWRRGRYELIEAAQVLANSAALDAKQLAEQMDAAIHKGKLTYRVNNIRIDQEHIAREHLWHRIVFQDDVNAWLAAEAIADRLRLEYPYPEQLSPVTGERAAVPHQAAMVMYPRLTPKSEWKGGLLADTDTVTLDEAARFAIRQAGQDVTPGDFLRAAARGQIPLRAVVHRSARTRACSPDDEPLNAGNPVPKDSIPTLPIDACKALANVGRSNWRTFESLTEIGGVPHRYVRWELAEGEPDFETTLADCRVTGLDVHALADAVAAIIYVKFAPKGKELGPMDNVLRAWPAARACLQEFNFYDIKEVAGLAGFDVTATAHLVQKSQGGATKGQLMSAIDGEVAKMDSGTRSHFLTILLEELLRRRPEAQDRLAEYLSRLGWSFVNQTLVPVGVFDISALEDTPDEAHRDLLKAAQRLRDGDLGGAISAACGAVDAATSKVYEEFGLGDPTKASFQERCRKAAFAKGVLTGLDHQLDALGWSQADIAPFKKNLEGALNQGAYVMQTLRSHMGDVHGTKPILRSLVFDSLRWAEVIVASLVDKYGDDSSRLGSSS